MWWHFFQFSLSCVNPALYRPYKCLWDPKYWIWCEVVVSFLKLPQPFFIPLSTSPPRPSNEYVLCLWMLSLVLTKILSRNTVLWMAFSTISSLLYLVLSAINCCLVSIDYCVCIVSVSIETRPRPRPELDFLWRPLPIPGINFRDHKREKVETQHDLVESNHFSHDLMQTCRGSSFEAYNMSYTHGTASNTEVQKIRYPVTKKYSYTKKITSPTTSYMQELGYITNGQPTNDIKHLKCWQSRGRI